MIREAEIGFIRNRFINYRILTKFGQPAGEWDSSAGCHHLCEKPGHEVHPRANDDESMEIMWVPIDEVPDRKLLTAMRTDWPSFERRLRALAVEHKGE